VDSIEKNLYEFYRIFRSVKSVIHISENGFEEIHANDKSWPQMIFNLNQAIDPLKLIPAIAGGIENKKYPRYFIAPGDYISRTHTELLKTNFIIPVKIITGMNYIPKRSETISLPPKFEIQDLNSEAQLIDFAQLIRTDFISSEMTFHNEILTGISSCNEIQMTGLFLGKTLVSAMLVLTKDNIAGLYFITTAKEHQKKGYATILINFILYRLHDEGVKEVVLHANHYSFGIYRKIGFNNQNRFIIYKRL
jgi:ribosomal protein S18 acetylase RimI-like enzyme